MEAKAPVNAVVLYAKKTPVDFICFIYTRIYWYLKDSRDVVRWVLPLIARMALSLWKAQTLCQNSPSTKFVSFSFLVPSLCDILEQMCFLSLEKLEVLIQSITSEMEKS